MGLLQRNLFSVTLPLPEKAAKWTNTVFQV